MSIPPIPLRANVTRASCPCLPISTGTGLAPSPRPMPHYPLIEPLEPRQLLAATHIRIDVGATSPYTGAGGKIWQPDRSSEGGATLSSNFPVAATTDDRLFTTYRSGPAFGYSLPVAKGNYKLRLFFVEPSAALSKARTFSVTAEKKRILTNFKLTTAQTAVSKTTSITVRDGRLSLWFQGTKGTDAI